MKKIIIVSLILIVSTSLYLYHQGQWEKQRKGIQELKQEINEPIEVTTPVEVESDPEPKAEEKKVVITSPFNSDLRVVELKDETKQENNNDQQKQEEKRVVIDKPELKLRGIMRSGEKAIVNVLINEQLERLEKGDKIDGYQLVKVLRNEIVFEKQDKSFTFKLSDE